LLMGIDHSITRSLDHIPTGAPTAVLLMNYGGPERAEECEPYLRNIFLDPDLVPIPSFIRPLAASMIARRRAPKLIENYEAMGRYSPILEQTRAQAEALQVELGGGFRCFVGMSYWRPFIREASEEIAGGGFGRVVLLPLYPQQSRATTGSCLREARRCLTGHGYRPEANDRNYRPDTLSSRDDLRRAAGTGSCGNSNPATPPDSGPEALRKTSPGMTSEAEASRAISEIPSFWDEEGFLSAVADGVRGALGNAPENARVLFCAHGLPVSLARKDPYPAQVLSTVAALCERLDLTLAPVTLPGVLPFPPTRNSELGTRNSGERRGARLAWQSRVGPMKWLEPSVETVLEEWSREGATHAVLVPVAFVSEHSETLYELDVLYAGRARALGMAATRVPTVQTRPDFITALARLVRASSEPQSLPGSPAHRLTGSPRQRHPEGPSNGTP
jgi:ferrochelatase